VELLCRDAARAFARLEPALKARLGVTIDATAQNRLKKPQWKTDFALYGENLAPADLAGILSRAARADRNAAPARFQGTLIVSALSAWDQEQLTHLLGTDPTRTAPRPPAAGGSKGPLGTDVTRPLPDLTERQVTNALQRRRARPAKGAAKPA